MGHQRSSFVEIPSVSSVNDYVGAQQSHLPPKTTKAAVSSTHFHSRSRQHNASFGQTTKSTRIQPRTSHGRSATATSAAELRYKGAKSPRFDESSVLNFNIGSDTQHQSPLASVLMSMKSREQMVFSGGPRRSSQQQNHGTYAGQQPMKGPTRNYYSRKQHDSFLSSAMSQAEHPQLLKFVNDNSPGKPSSPAKLKNPHGDQVLWHAEEYSPPRHHRDSTSKHKYTELLNRMKLRGMNSTEHSR